MKEPDGKSNGKIRLIPILVVVLILSILTNILFWFLMGGRGEMLTVMERESTANNKYINELITDIKKYTNTETDLKLTKKKLEHYEGLDRRCIAQYIKDRYSATPALVADAIAEDAVTLAEKYKIPAALLVGVMEVESAFNPYSKSKKAARGLMQVRYEVWAEKLKIERTSDLHDINKGIEYGILVLKDYLGQTKGDLKKALWMYNGRDKDTNKYPNQVFTSIGRYIVYRCKTSDEMGGYKDEVIKDEIES